MIKTHSLHTLCLAVIAIFLQPSALTAAETSDQKMERIYATMAGRQQKVDGLLLAGRMGFLLDGTIAPYDPPSASPEEKALVKEENQDRQELFAHMARLSGRTGAEIAREWSSRVLGVCDKRIFREIKEGGQSIWRDGETVDIKISTAQFALTSAPPSLEVGARFDMELTLMDSYQRPLDFLELDGISFTFEAVPPNVFKPVPSALFKNGSVFWRALEPVSEAAALEILVTAAKGSKLEGKNFSLSALKVRPKPLTRHVLEKQLSTMDRELTQIMGMNPSTGRDRLLIEMREQLIRYRTEAASSRFGADLTSRINALIDKANGRNGPELRVNGAAPTPGNTSPDRQPPATPLSPP